jgi:TonB family protein
VFKGATITMRAGLGLALLLPWFAIASAQPKAKSGVDIRKLPKPPGAVQGKPYSGELRSETNGDLPDGTRITQTYLRSKEYRDSRGRTRREESIPPDSKNALQVITIYDPAAMVEYVLEPEKRIAHRFTLKESPPARVSLGPPEVSPIEGSSPDIAANVTAKLETLELQVIEGFPAEGVRRTLTIGDTSLLGDRGPTHLVIDTWTATDLQIIVLERDSNSGAGGSSETSTRMTNLRREEQPASLFEVPPSYRMNDELEDFIIGSPVRGRTSPPQVISRTTAKYTAEALRSGIQGKVLLSATVDKSGKVRDVQMEHSLDPGLDQEAIKAIRQWRFQPGREAGHAVEVDVRMEVTFGLN